MVMYTGSVAADAVFEPSNLSAGVFQIKYRSQAESKAESELRPIGVPRNLPHPLPYLAVVFELGDESAHVSGSKIQVTASPPGMDSFSTLRSNWMAAVKDLEEYRMARQGSSKRKRGKDAEEIRLQDTVKDEQFAMDSYNRFSISVRGSSPQVYGVLCQADIVDEFATLLRVTMPQPSEDDFMIEHMQPAQHLGDASACTAWMLDYVGQTGDDDTMGLDPQ